VVFEGLLASEVLGTQRMVRIYLPPGYSTTENRRYPVLYVHDGQNVFSTVGPHVAFGWGNWELDRTLDRLIRERAMREVIVVAVDATRDRFAEYRGPSAAARPADGAATPLPGTAGTRGTFDRYTRFLADELKPKIDAEYRTLSEPEHTASLGVSLGGICSVALAWERPGVFGGAASLSGAFQVEHRYFLERVLGATHRRDPRFRCYLDSGEVSMNGGDDGRRNTEAVAAEFQRLGWKAGTDLLHYVDPVLTEEALVTSGLSEGKRDEAARNQHNEFYWRQRMWRALTFLFTPPR
jgi:predicted alpha/beta superfamily hydrolase